MDSVSSTVIVSVEQISEEFEERPLLLQSDQDVVEVGLFIFQARNAREMDSPPI